MAKLDANESEWLRDVASHLEEREVGVKWPVLLAALGFAGSIVYGAWALSQSQLSNVIHQIEQLRNETADRRSEIRASIDILRRDIDAGDTKQSAELTRRENEVKAKIDSINGELERRRSQFADARVFDEFQRRVLDDIDIIRKQLILLEQTRPTAGTLEAVATAAKEQATRFEDRIHAMESALPSRSETGKQFDTINERINRLYELYQDLNRMLNARGQRPQQEQGPKGG
jgi:chromosome segregation ATPase